MSENTYRISLERKNFSIADTELGKLLHFDWTRGNTQITISATIMEMNFFNVAYWNFSPQRVPFWILYWNLSPGGELFVDGKWIKMESDKVYLLSPFTPFQSRNHSSFMQFYLYMKLSSNIPVVRGLYVFPSDLLKQNFLFIEDTLSPTKGALRIIGVFCQYFSMLPDSVFLKAEEIIDSRIYKALQIIEKEYSMPLPLKSLSRRVNMSLNNFLRVFKMEMKTTPKRYILRTRISKVAELLVKTDMKLDEIVEKTGFSNRFHLSKAFKRMVGSSPGCYREATSTRC
ncbi:MAG: HTH-type transcriptional activator Btr [Lentisphaerae bacterium ADurb.Bin242]|nr:MAG: HTH-type transcriptional activator Btr [Lentisphaerae bacterium ADurb.Bin242]